MKQYEGGWLEIVAPTGDEPELTETVLDDSLSYTDAELIVIAERRALRLLTDDRHVGTVAARHDVESWDLTLSVRAACERDVIDSADELRTLIEDLRREDYYEFSAEDEQYLFDAF